MTEELKDYIREQKEKGFSDEQIRKALLGAGWSRKDINKVIGKKGGSKKGLLIGIMVIIILIVAILAVVFNIGGIGDLFKKSGEVVCVDQCGNRECQKIVCQADGCPCPETLSSCPEDCEEIVWQTYQDEEYGFEVKYPDRVSYLDKNQREMGDYEGVERRLDLKVDDSSYISVYIWQKDIAEELDYDFETPDYQETTIDNEKGFKGEKEYDGFYFIETYIYKDIYIYQIEYFGSENSESKNLYKQIVSTFKFLE